MKCIVCAENTRKYKCSKCVQYCCSLDCYKTHQSAEACSATNVDSQDSAEKKDDQFPAKLVPFSTEDTVDPVRLQELGNSEKLKELLYNPHLRAFIQQIDESPDAWKAMKIAMLEPLFVEFADECLKIVEPETN